MLVWLIRMIFGIADFLLEVLLVALPVCAVLQIFMPQNKYVLLAGRYLNAVLMPIRKWMDKLLPRLTSSAIGPYASWLALWLVLSVGKWLLQLLQRILI